MESRIPHLPPPPRAINALVNGFNTVANNLSVILLPAFLDFFLWFGPQLKMNLLVAPLIEFIGQMPDPVQFQPAVEALTEFSQGFNLFAALRTYPFGIYSLMSTSLSLQTPLGERIQISPESMAVTMLLVLALTVLGWLGGSFYYFGVARAVFKEKTPSVLRSLFHTLFLSGAWLILFFIFNIPAIVMVGVLSMFGSTVRTLILVLLSFPLSWLLVGVFYSAHGIYAHRQNALRSVWSSFRMVRYSLPNIGWFSVMAIIISQGMDMLWQVPPANSWMTLVGILGHAFVSTSLLAASFFYYRDVNVWIESVLQWLKTNNPSSARA